MTRLLRITGSCSSAAVSWSFLSGRSDHFAISGRGSLNYPPRSRSELERPRWV